MPTVQLHSIDFKLLQRALNLQILAIPTGELRNMITHLHIKVMELQLAYEGTHPMADTDTVKLELTDEELTILRSAVSDAFDNANNDDDARELSDIHMKLGGDPLWVDEDEDDLEDKES